MKRILAVLVAFGMVFCAAALASEGVLVDDAPYTDFYDCATTAEGNAIVALGLRYERNTAEGEHGQKARLACLDADGDVLWETVEDQGNGAYAGVCVLADGTVQAMYVDRTNPTKEKFARFYLRSFSPTGEQTGEIALPDDYFHSVETDAGMLVSVLDVNQPKPYPRSTMLYGGTLTPVWTLEDFALSGRYDSACAYGEGMVLLCRKTGWQAEELIDQVRLIRIGSDGQELWSRVLAEQQMGYMNIQTDPDGNIVAFMNGWLDNGMGQSADGTLLCFDPDGNELWQKPLSFPEKGGHYELTGFRLLPDGYLFMGLAKTQTRVRLYRYDSAGALVGHTDHYMEEEANYSGPDLAGPMDRLRVFVALSEEDRRSLWMMPLKIPQ
ncbi:MAG TPA: hypothetical protein PKE04_05445 [Clostridia bacterium]|nr:hypothetical protein [Clostridia bacterium]